MLRHSLWKRWSQFRHDNKGEADRDEEEGKKLAASKAADQARVRLAKIFNHNSKDRVADEKQTDQNTIGLTRPRADQPENQEKNNSFKKSFVELRGMPWSQNSPQDFFNLRVIANGRDDCVR